MREDAADHWLSTEVRSALEADLLIGNLECVLLPRQPPIKDGLRLGASAERCLESLKAAGFDVLVLANNHIMDYGVGGLQHTLCELKRAGISVCGAGLTAEDARRPLVTEIQGVRIGILARVHERSFLSIGRFVAGPKVAGIALLEEEIFESLRRCREACDYAILSVHWGYQDLHRAPVEVHDWAERLLDAGVDLILGSHAHVVQGIIRRGPRRAFLGLGNFYFHPLPYENVPHGILYGPQCVSNRSSVIASIRMGAETEMDIVPVYQGGDERIIMQDGQVARRIKRAMTGAWARRSQWNVSMGRRVLELKRWVSSIRVMWEHRRIAALLKSLSLGLVKVLWRASFRPRGK